MRIVFDNKNFTESLEICFKGQHQVPLIMVLRLYKDATTGDELQPDLIWCSSHIWRYPLFRFRKALERLRAKKGG